MAYLGVLDDIRTCVNLGVPGRVPVFGITGEFDIRMSGITHSEYSRNPEKMAACQIQGVRNYDFDWVFLIPDDYIPIDPLGITLLWQEHVPPTATQYLPVNESALARLKMPNPRTDGRMPAFLEALGAIKDELGDTICLTGNVAAPFSSVALLYGLSDTLLLIFDNSQFLKKAMKFFVDYQIEWGRAQIEAGADAIWLGDCVASSAFISSDQFSEFAAEGAYKVSESLKEEGAFVFYHAGDKSLEHLKLMADVNASALSVGEGIDIAEAKATLGKRTCLLGNIDGLRVLMDGNVEDVERETRRIVEAGKRGGGYIFNSGEAIPYQTTEENIRTMVTTARECGRFF